MQHSPKVFPVISMGKFTTLYFVTMGWYAVYWFYKCWIALGQDSGRKIFPFFRCLFAVFYVHELFAYIQKSEIPEDRYPWNPSKSAWLFIGVGAVGAALSFIAEYLLFNRSMHLLIFIVLLVVQYYVLYKVQLVINRIGKDPYGRCNTKLTLENNLWGAFGIYLWMSSFYTCYLDMTGQIIKQPASETQIQNNTILPTEEDTQGL